MPQMLAHRVERGGKPAEFILPKCGDRAVQLPGADGGGRVGHFGDGPYTARRSCQAASTANRTAPRYRG